MRRDYLGRYIKPYFFGHVDTTKGFYNEERKNYLKHDTSMDYLREIMDEYRTARITTVEPISSILTPYKLSEGTKYDATTWNRPQIRKIIYEIEKFKKNTYCIWNGYAENSERYKMLLLEEEKLIEFINGYDIRPETMYRLLIRLDENGMSDFMMKILFNIGNKLAYELIIKSSSPVFNLYEDFEGEIKLYDYFFKKIQKTSPFLPGK